MYFVITQEALKLKVEKRVELSLVKSSFKPQMKKSPYMQTSIHSPPHPALCCMIDSLETPLFFTLCKLFFFNFFNTLVCVDVCTYTAKSTRQKYACSVETDIFLFIPLSLYTSSHKLCPQNLFWSNSL